jgi:hypothetical protein
MRESLSAAVKRDAITHTSCHGNKSFFALTTIKLTCGSYLCRDRQDEEFAVVDGWVNSDAKSCNMRRMYFVTVKSVRSYNLRRLGDNRRVLTRG